MNATGQPSKSNPFVCCWEEGKHADWCPHHLATLPEREIIVRALVAYPSINEATFNRCLKWLAAQSEPAVPR